MADLSEPDHGELLRLHAELCAGEDPTVPARLAELLLPALLRRFRNVAVADPHAVNSLVGLSIARYLRDPARYHPEQGPLLAFLWRDVEGDRKNELASRASRRTRETPASHVIDFERADRNLVMEEEILDALDPFDLSPERLDAAQRELASFSDQDRELLMLMSDSVRETVAYSEILGITHLPTETQQRQVKRHKDRLKARLEVIRGRLGLPR